MSNIDNNNNNEAANEYEGFAQIEENLLHKKILKEGVEDPPIDGSSVRVHYTGTLYPSGEKFDSSRDRDEPFQFTLGKGQVIKGWDKGVATMKVGERCILRCSPEYAYGKMGSPPKIPANSTLDFDVELLSWSEPEKSKSEMSTEELLEGASKDKALGNELFKSGEYSQAAEKYKEALNWLIHVYQERERATPVQVAVNLNKSACHLKLLQWGDAVSCCNEVLEVDDDNVKALLRRSQAHVGLADFGLAKEDVIRAIKVRVNRVNNATHVLLLLSAEFEKVFTPLIHNQLDPKNKTLRAHYTDVCEKIKAAKEAERQAFSKIFSGEGGYYDDHVPEKITYDGPIDSGSEEEKEEGEEEGADEEVKEVEEEGEK